LTDYQHIKHVLKALALVEYLMKHSGERFVADVQVRSDVFRRLKHYKYYKDGVDIGEEVRAKAGNIMMLIEDMDHLLKERAIAQRIDGRIESVSYQYSNHYSKDEDVKQDTNPFGSMQEKSPEEIKYDEEEKPKKKNKKAKKTKKVKEIDEEPETIGHMDDEGEQPLEVQVSERIETPPIYHEEESDFVSDLMNAPRPIMQSHDLITGGMNNAVSNHFNWLAPQEQDTLTQEIALFDVPQQKDEIVMKHVDVADVLNFAPAQVHNNDEPRKKEVDAWDLAKEISVLDDLNMTSEEKRWKTQKEERKLKLQQGPKLKELVKQNSRPMASDPFQAAIQGDPNSMAIVPAAAWNTPMYNPEYSQAIVPYGSFPAVYGYPQYPYYPQQYSWN